MDKVKFIQKYVCFQPFLALLLATLLIGRNPQKPALFSSIHLGNDILIFYFWSIVGIRWIYEFDDTSASEFGVWRLYSNRHCYFSFFIMTIRIHLGVMSTCVLNAWQTNFISIVYLISFGVSSSSYFFISFLRNTNQMIRMMRRTPNDTPTTAPATTPIPLTSTHTWTHKSYKSQTQRKRQKQLCQWVHWYWYWALK